MDRTKADGLRLDAVKHVPRTSSASSRATARTRAPPATAARRRAVQPDARLQRLRTTTATRCFDTEKPRDDLMMFGEHLGEPPGYGDYFDAGMRLVDNAAPRQTSTTTSAIPGHASTGSTRRLRAGVPVRRGTGVMYAKSHDDDYATRPELQYALYFTRAGLPNIYTDGNHQAETLGAERRRVPAPRQHGVPRPVRRQPHPEPRLHPQRISRAATRSATLGRRRRRGLRAAATSARTAA